MRTVITVCDNERGNGVEVLMGAHGGGEVHWAEWKEYSTAVWFMVYHEIVDDAMVDSPHGPAMRHKERKLNEHLHLRLLAKYLLLDTSLLQVEHNQEGELSDECLRQFMGMRPKIVEALMHKVRMEAIVDDDETEMIGKECFSFFSSTKGGVENPCYALHLHSVLSDFWDNYGLSLPALSKFPARDGVRLKEVLSVKAQVSQIDVPKPPKAPRSLSTHSGPPGARPR